MKGFRFLISLRYRRPVSNPKSRPSLAQETNKTLQCQPNSIDLLHHAIIRQTHGVDRQKDEIATTGTAQLGNLLLAQV